MTMNIDKKYIRYNNSKRKYMKIKYFEFDKAQKYLKEGKISNHILENPVRYNLLISENSAIPKDAFWVDKRHKNGPEIHVVCNDATILIFNADSKKLCTILFGRPGQIERYYVACQKEVPKEIMKVARENQLEGKNIV